MVLISLKPKSEAGYIDEDPVTCTAELFEDLTASWKGKEHQTHERVNDDEIHDEIQVLTRQREYKDVWMTSYEDLDGSSADHEPYARHPKIIANTRGFAGAMIYAYQNDLSVVIRPDDVWLAILAQFGTYVNKHAEELRSKIAGFEGEKQLEIDMRHDMNNKTLKGLAQKVITAIGKDVLTTPFASGLMPKFSTTTDTDKWVATIAILGSLSHYIEDAPDGNCGLTNVRLEGRKSDWKSICDRVRALGEGDYGDEVKEWAGYLSVVCQHFLMTVEKRGTEEVRDFWNSICDVGGSGEDAATWTLSGWITAFCFWDPDGNRIKNHSPDEVKAMNAKDDDDERQEVVLDDVRFPVISAHKSIPSGVSEVQIRVAQEHEQVQYDVSVVAGFMGLKCMKQATGRTGLDTVQPVPGYWMIEDDCTPLWKKTKALYD